MANKELANQWKHGRVAARIEFSKALDQLLYARFDRPVTTIV